MKFFCQAGLLKYLSCSLLLVSALGCSSNEEFIFEPQFKTVRVPGDLPTIQDAVDSTNNGDTILIADGLFTGPGNTDVIISRKSITIMSENGAKYTVIDCNGHSNNPHRAFDIKEQESSNTTIEGLTIMGSYSTSGAAVMCKSASPTFKNCLFINNESSVSGGAIRCKDASPTFINCTFVANSAGTGGAIFGLASSSPYLSNCIIAFSGSGESIAVADGSSQPTLFCCNLFGNTGGDWGGALVGQANKNGNFSLNPKFCDTLNDNYALSVTSPCAPANNSCNVLIGALPVGCD